MLRLRRSYFREIGTDNYIVGEEKNLSLYPSSVYVCICFCFYFCFLWDPVNYTDKRQISKRKFINIYITYTHGSIQECVTRNGD